MNQDTHGRDQREAYSQNLAQKRDVELSSSTKVFGYHSHACIDLYPTAVSYTWGFLDYRNASRYPQYHWYVFLHLLTLDSSSSSLYKEVVVFKKTSCLSLPLTDYSQLPAHSVFFTTC